MDWSIQEIARLTGTTSRTLRHYDDVGILPPTRTAANGYRHYDEHALIRLQRILLLRELGLSLPLIGEILDRQHNQADALRAHVALLRQEQDRLTRQITAVEHTLAALTEGEQLMADTMFDGFDHTQYREEVERRWGADAYAQADQWWNAKSTAEKRDMQNIVSELQQDWAALAASGAEPGSQAAQALAARHVVWLRSVPGIPDDFAGYVRGLATLYVDDPRFAAHYAVTAAKEGDTARSSASTDGIDTSGAEFVRDSLLIFADTAL